MNVKYTRVSAMEMTILSELAHFNGGVSPTDLARRTKIERPSLYVALRRLALRKPALVTSSPDGRVRYAGPVYYAITTAGRRERVLFAKMVGLKV